MTSSVEVTGFLSLMLILGEDFDTRFRNNEWIPPILSSTSIEGGDKFRSAVKLSRSILIGGNAPAVAALHCDKRLYRIHGCESSYPGTEQGCLRHRCWSQKLYFSPNWI